MTIVPKNRLDRLEFFEAHLPVWAKNPAAIGLSAAQLDDLTARTIEARSRFDFLESIRLAAEAATSSHHNASDTMYDLGADLIATIKTFAALTDDPGVYAAAQIPSPSPPSPSGPPVKPTRLAATLLSPFGLRLKWRGTTARGAFFNIYRKIGTGGALTLLTSAAGKGFDDTTVPGGADLVTYYIEARRGRHSVMSNPLPIALGPAAIASLTLAA
jgi:hypothetical protein